MTKWYEWLLALVWIPLGLFLLVKFLERVNPAGKPFRYFTDNQQKRGHILEQLSYEISMLEQAGLDPPEVFGCKKCNRATYGAVVDGHHTQYCAICADQFPDPQQPSRCSERGDVK